MLISLDEKVSKIRQALEKLLNPGSDMYEPMVAANAEPYAWTVELYETYAIVNKGDKNYRVDYSIGENGIEIGEMVEVERDWKPVTKSIATFKIGAEISARNHARIQAAHDTMVEMGAICKDPSYVEVEGEKSVDLEDTVIAFGGNVKAVQVDGGWKVRAPLVVFTNPNDTDLTGDYFDASTDFDMEFPGKSTAYFNHGMDSHFKRRRLEPVKLEKDDFGVWAEGILRESDEYEKFLIELGKAGKLGMSSGVPGHLVETEAVGKANHITYWPLGKDASYTHTPAEPKTRLIIPLKSLIIGETPQEPDGALVDAATKTDPILPKEEPAEMTPEEIKALVDQAAKAAVEEYKRAEPATVNAGANITVIKDEADQPFKSAGEFLSLVKSARLYPEHADRRIRPLWDNSIKATGMSEGVPADGGYLIPPQFASGMLQNMWNTGEILSRVSTDPVTGNSMTYNAVDETSRVAGSRMGGILGYWMGEGSTLTKSKPAFRQVELKLKKEGALVYATDEQLEDTANLESFLMNNVPNELRFLAEDAIFEGDGVGKPWGIIASPCLVSFARTDANKILHDDVMKMWARRKVGGKYVWLVNQDTTPQLDQMYITSGIEGRFIDYDAQGVLRMKGAPVIEIEYAQSLGTLGDIVLADLSQYKLITKGGVRAESSIHVQFLTDEMTYRFIYRCDGAPLWASAVTPFHGSNTVSPFVALTAAS